MCLELPSWIRQVQPSSFPAHGRFLLFLSPLLCFSCGQARQGFILVACSRISHQLRILWFPVSFWRPAEPSVAVFNDPSGFPETIFFLPDESFPLSLLWNPALFFIPTSRRLFWYTGITCNTIHLRDHRTKTHITSLSGNKQKGTRRGRIMSP